MILEIIALTAAIIAAIGLIINAVSFFRFKKTEELRVLEGIYREIASGLKQHGLLEAEDPKLDEIEVHSRKLNVLLEEFFADVSWLSFLILQGKIKDETLINAFKGQIITWYRLFEKYMPDKVHNPTSYIPFKVLYLKLTGQDKLKSEDKKSVFKYLKFLKLWRLKISYR